MIYTYTYNRAKSQVAGSDALCSRFGAPELPTAPPQGLPRQGHRRPPAAGCIQPVQGKGTYGKVTTILK